MTDARNSEGAKNKKKKTIISMVVGGLVGFVGAFSIMRADDAGIFGDLAETSVIGLLIAMLYIAMGLFVGMGAANPKAGAKFLNVEDADELEEMRTSLVASAISITALGVLLALCALGGDKGIVAMPYALAGAAASILVGCFFAWRSYAASDELMREVSRASAAVSYYLLFAVIGGWAMLAQFDVVAPPSAMALLNLFWSIALLSVFIVAGKRGMLETR